MPAALKIIASGQLAATTTTTLATVAANTALKVATFSITNTSTSPVVISAGVVPSGGAADGTHDVLKNYSLAAGDVITSEDVLSACKGAFLDAGTTIVAKAGTAAVINYLVTGAVIS
jgi:hypothetical protein